MSEMTTGPLAGVRVVDLTIWVQGPLASTLLADLGADVIKVEKAGGGDFSRNLTALYGVDLRREDAPNLLWALCNRNKRALTLDLHNAPARPVFERLLAEADVFVTNLHPKSLRDFRADEPSVRAVNDRIVYALASGLGVEGSWAEDPCQDTVGMAYGGFMFTASPAADQPYYPPGAISDVLSGTMLAFGILAALAQRGRTGEGQTVSASQLQSLMWLQMLNIGVQANLGAPFARQDRARPQNALTNTYRCADGRWLALGLILADHWPLLCRAAGLDLLDDERFSTPGSRVRHAAALGAILDAHFATAPAAGWLDRLRAAGLWVAPVNRAEELIDDAQAQANGYIQRLDDGARTVAMPFTLTGHTPSSRPSPTYSADSDAILAELGLDEAAITALRVAGAVW